MPKPHSGEARDDFLSRCMGDSEAVSDYPESAQRYAVCNGLWDQHMSDKSALLESVRKRSTRSGIITADRYFREMEGCFEGGACPLKVGEGSEESWRKALSEAESKLTYSDESMRIVAKRRKGRKDDKARGGILTFDAILTTSMRDRDGDVLMTKGAKLDEYMPLLWQHSSMQPIGKFVKVVQHTDNTLICRFQIAGTDLGRDVAKLVKLGALRMSHGFDPIDYELMEDEKGWLFKSFSIYEASLVSIPANESARILSVVKSHAGDEFQTDLVRGWVKSLAGAEQLRSASDATQDSPSIIVSESECTCRSGEFKEVNVGDRIKADDWNKMVRKLNELSAAETPREFHHIEREYFAELAKQQTDVLRRAHRHTSLILKSAEDQEQAREMDDVLALFH